MTSDNDDKTDETEMFDEPLETADRDRIEREIAAGGRALKTLLSKAGRDWHHWSAVILGLRGLRTLVFDKVRTNNMRSDAFRKTMSEMLKLRKYAIFQKLTRQDRSDCYRLMDHLDEIDDWYNGLKAEQKLSWNTPGAVARNCPKEFLSSLRQHERPLQPQRLGQRKPLESAEAVRLRRLLIQVIKRLLKYEPEARDLLDQVEEPSDPSDSVDDLFVTKDAGDSS